MSQQSDLQSNQTLLKENANLKQEIKQLKSRKRYGLIWEDKSEDVVEVCKKKLPVLDEDTGKSIHTDNSKPMNMLIEGDNYHALSVLNYTHQGKIDVIYIDPPYNTGSEDFKYNDKFVDKEDGYRHSKWLSFMDKRLRLAKSLLNENGQIFISIDDNENAQLKLLCNQIFGENRFIGTITWEKRTKAQNTETAKEMLQSKTEYILVYKKGSEKARFKLEITREKTYDKEDEKGLYRLKVVEEMSARGMRGRPTMVFPILGIFPKEFNQWKYGKDQIEKFKVREDLILENGRPHFKIRPQDESSNNYSPFWSHFFDKDTSGTAESGKSELNSILGNKEHNFETVKPIKLIQKLLYHSSSKGNELILDFFAGSGTTGHAVLQLNQEDGGNRQFILCTNNENGIAEEVCYPRIKKVIEGWNGTAGLGGNLKYYKTEFVDAETTDKNKKKLVDKSTELLCLKEDCFELVKSGEDFNVFKNAKDEYLGIVYDDNGIENIKQAIKNLNKKTVIYIFSLDESAREEDFEDIAELVSLKPIPTGILNVYRRIF